MKTIAEIIVTCSLFCLLVLPQSCVSQSHQPGQINSGSIAHPRPAQPPSGQLTGAPPRTVRQKTTTAAPRAASRSRIQGLTGTRPDVVLVPWSQSPGNYHGQAQAYTVQPGDTLAAIARKFYGNPSQWRLIYNNNRNLISNPDNLPIGTKLQIPAAH